MCVFVCVLMCVCLHDIPAYPLKATLVDRSLQSLCALTSYDDKKWAGVYVCMGACVCVCMCACVHVCVCACVCGKAARERSAVVCEETHHASPGGVFSLYSAKLLAVE